MEANIMTADHGSRTAKRKKAFCNCGMPMELVTIFQQDKQPEQIWMCPKCHEPELGIWRK